MLNFVVKDPPKKEVNRVDDLLITGGTVITMDRPFEAAAVAVKNGLVAWVGGREEARCRQARETVDLKGAALLPAFIDTHVHLTATGMDRGGPALSLARSLEQALGMIADAAARLAPGEPLWCGGYDPSTITERRMPTRNELDAVAGERVVWVSHAEYHAGAGNSQCLRSLGLDGSSDMNGIDRDLDGRATGLLVAEANGLARRMMGERFGDEVRRMALHRAAEEAAAHGVVTVHAMEGGALFSDRDVEALFRFGGELPVDTVLYWQITDVERVRQAGLPRIGGCVPLDGSTGTHTGAMIEPYSDAPGCTGLTYLSESQLDEWVMEAHRLGMQVSMHVGGDRSIEILLNAFEKALNAFPRAGHRHRIEHFEVPQPHHFERAARLGVALAMQPAFDHFWGQAGGDYQLTLGEARWARTNAVGTAVRHGILVGGGSDSCVTPIDPLLGVHAAVNHHRADERLSVAAALRLFTVDAARLAFQENDRGTLTPGKRADMVVLAENPLAVPPEAIRSIEVLATFRKGAATFSRL